jgi:hypothetical protein
MITYRHEDMARRIIPGLRFCCDFSKDLARQYHQKEYPNSTKESGDEAKRRGITALNVVIAKSIKI